MTMAKGKAPPQAAQESNGVESKVKAQKKLSYPTVIHPDLYQRANFTLQASTFLQHLQLESAAPTGIKGQLKASNRDGNHSGDYGDASARLARNMMAANEKMVVHNQMKLFVPVLPFADELTMKGSLDQAHYLQELLNCPHSWPDFEDPKSTYHMNNQHTTCIACDFQRTIPLPPTSLCEEEAIDGRKRAPRRQRLAKHRKIPFHQREAVSNPDGLSTSKGHTLFRKQETIHNWGESQPASGSLEKDTSAVV